LIQTQPDRITKIEKPGSAVIREGFEKLNQYRMKNRSVSTFGAMHPILFFAGVYIVVLFFSIFICSALFYSCNTSETGSYTQQEQKAPETERNNNVIAAVK
jgi:hypothetical protein